MKKAIYWVVPLALLLAVSFPAGQAGAECGPGSVLIRSKGALFQSFLASTNLTFFPTYTAAFTLKTSGCSRSGIIVRKKEQEVFVAVNLEPLTQQMAQGRGVYLEAFSGLLGCPAVAYGDFSRMTREAFPRLVPEPAPQPELLLQRVKTEMARDARLAGRCAGLG